MPTRSEYLKRIDLAEQTADIAPWGIVHIRELDAAQRVEASRHEEETRNNGLYTALSGAHLWAYVVRCGLLDEPGGRPIFHDGDIPALIKKRPSALSALGGLIWSLSEAAPGDMKSGDPAADRGQLDTESGAESPDGDSGSGGGSADPE